MSEPVAMSEGRFVELVGCYGADLSRWPEQERVQAETLMRDAPHRLRDVWESERMFDMLLALDADPAPSIELEEIILASMPTPSASAPAGRRWLPAIAPAKWLGGGALAASLGLGFFVGYAGTPAQSPVGAEYAQLLSLTEAGAGEVFFSAGVETD